MLTTNHLVPRLKMNGVIRLLLLHAFMTLTGTHLLFYSSLNLKTSRYGILKNCAWNINRLDSRVEAATRWLMWHSWLIMNSVSFFFLAAGLRGVWLYVKCALRSYRGVSDSVFVLGLSAVAIPSCDSWRMKDQLDVTCCFISRLMCSTCFGH
jgi:hypothetical protein